MTVKPWHKRWHGNALVGMRELSLELRGAYTTILDVMYDAGGPVRLDERRLCGELDCDVRVFKRVMTALLAADKIRLWSDGKTVWLVNDKVLEITSTKGFSAATCAGLTPNLRDKFGIAIAELSPNSDENSKENNDPKNQNPEKTPPRGRGEKKEPPIVPQGDPEPSKGSNREEPLQNDEVRQAFDDWNSTADRCGLAKALDLTEARRRSIGKRLKAGGLERWRSALAAVEASAFCLGQAPPRDGGKPFKASLDFVCQQSSFQKLIEGFYGQDAKPVFARVQALPIDPNDKWRARVRNHLAKLQYWNADDLGPAPGKPGCIVPAEVLREFGLEPAPPVLRVIA